jgi:hypothetical protein
VAVQFSSFAVSNGFEFTVSAGDGDDTIDVSAVQLPAFGTSNGGHELAINAGIGDDTVIGSPSIQSELDGGEGADTLRITADGELLFTQGYLLTANGNQSVLNGFEQADLRGGAGADTIDAQQALFPVDISSAGGDDRIFASPAGGTLDGGEGADSIQGNSATDSVIASPGADQIAGVSAAHGDLLTLSADSAITLVSVPLANGGAELSWASNTSFLNGSFAEVQLSGGPSANTIDASGYSGRTRLMGEGGTTTPTVFKVFVPILRG